MELPVLYRDEAVQDIERVVVIACQHHSRRPATVGQVLSQRLR